MKFSARSFLLLSVGALLFQSAETKSLPVTKKPFTILWSEMQWYYKTASQAVEKCSNNSDQYTSHWESSTKEISDMLLGDVNQNFLRHKTVIHNMVRTNPERDTVENSHLSSCISKDQQKLFRDINNAADKDPYFWFPVNRAGMQYYASKVNQLINIQKKSITITEIGGGFGDLCRTFKEINPDATYIIFDLPEMLAMQYLYLSSMVDSPVIFHTKLPRPEDLTASAIHLVPSVFMNEMTNFKTDVFVSTFALSETSEEVQQFVIDQAFFNAKCVYIVGQIDGWKGIGMDWIVDHSLLLDAIHSSFKLVITNPYHYFDVKMQSYEALARK